MYQSKFEWQVRERTAQISDQLAEKYKLNHLEQAILENRGYVDEKDLDDVLNPSYHSFKYIYDIDQAVERINQAFSRDESILIYGDFDADGITSTAILYDALLKKTVNVECFIPNRLTDGYGPNETIFKEFVIDNFDLVITVDNGVSAISEINLLREHGIDAIIVDHHEFAQTLPDAIVIHPSHPNGDYPYSELAGVGITYKLIEALGLHEDTYLGFVAIGTVADLVPMTGENKRFVIDGVKILNTDMPLGVKNLLKVGGHSGPVDEETISFTIAPRLNATGRLDEASSGVELLLTNDPNTAYESASYIESLNTERKAQVQKIYEEAKGHLGDEDVIIVYQEGWHPGVLGIVASRLADNYGKPAIVLTLSEDEPLYKGSARSVDGLDFLSIVKDSSTHYQKCGGHSRAFGIEVNETEVDAFKQELVDYFNHIDMSFKPVKKVDYSIDQFNLTLADFEHFNRLKPFGHEFIAPIFMMSNAIIKTLRQVGKDGAHIKITLQNMDIDIIGFQFGYLAEEVSLGDNISMIGILNINEFNQDRKLQMILQDIRIDQVQLLDMRSRATQNFSIISDDDYFMINNGERRSSHYFYYGEVLPFTMNTLVLRDLPENIEVLKTSLKGIHVSKIIMIFNSKEELYFGGIPTEAIIEDVHSTIGAAKDGAINLIEHAPRFASKLNINMKMLKMTIDILEELNMIAVKNGIVYKEENFDFIKNIPVHESVLMKQLLARLDSESQLKMSSTNELKALIRDMI